MLIPIGHERTEIRRVPWLTIALVGVCLLAFLASLYQQGRVEPRIVEARDAVWGYFAAHPYLELEPRLAELLFPGSHPTRRQAAIQALRDAHREFVFDFQKRDEQSRLEALSERLLVELDGHPFQRWGLVPGRQTAAGWLSHMFMHGGWLHLIGNLLLLFLMGFCIEELWGRPLFTGLYLGSGLASAGLFVALYPALDVPLIGASGAVAGLMGAFLVRCWSVRIRFLFWVMLVSGTFSAPAWLVLPLWFSNEILSAVLMDRLMPGTGGGGVAHWAHVGGFAFGLAVALGVRLLRIEERWVAPRIEAKLEVASNPLIERAGELRAQERDAEAFELLAREVRSDPRNHDAGIALWDVARHLDRVDEVLPALQRLIRQAVQEGSLDVALGLVREQSEGAPPDVPADFAALMRLGSALAAAERNTDAALVFRAALREGCPPLTGPVALRVVRAVRGVDSGVALRAAESALASADLAPRLRSELETIASQHEVPEKPEPDLWEGLGPTGLETGPAYAPSPPPLTGGTLEALDLEADREEGALELDTDGSRSGPTPDDLVPPLELDPDAEG
jgi:membrane associated rhomboid family serine protease